MYIRTNPSLPAADPKIILEKLVASATTIFSDKMWITYDVDASTRDDYTIEEVESACGGPLESLGLLELVLKLDVINDIKIAQPAQIPQDTNPLDGNIPVKADVYIEFFDSTYWTVFSRNETFMQSCLEILMQ